MSRAVPWRTKPTPAVVQLLPQAKELRMYQVGEVGPTSFVFQDDSEAKFKVIIGYDLSCSCTGRMTDHCMHTLYVMLKKFKVEESHAILWQGGYTDQELEDLVGGKFSIRSVPKAQHVSFKAHRLLVRNRITEQPEEDDLFVNVGDEDECPICAEQLNTECYSQCHQCRNCMHSRCLGIWTKHKIASKTQVTCPMCRARFMNPLELVRVDQEKWKNRKFAHKSRCFGCDSNRRIIGSMFQCLECPVKMCSKCYEGSYHSKHHSYLVKVLPEEEWRPAVEKNNTSFIKKARDAESRIYLSSEDYPAEKQMDDRKELAYYINRQYDSADEFAIQTLPTILQKQKQDRSISSLGVIGNEIRNKGKEICQRCGKVGNQFMRRLECGHNVHDECLLEMIEARDLQCTIDGEPTLKGYACAFSIPTNIRPKRKVESAEKINSQTSSIIKKPSRQLSGSKADSALSSRPLQLNLLGNKEPPSHKPDRPTQPNARAFRIKKNHERKQHQPPLPPSLPELQGTSFQPVPSRLLLGRT